MMIDLGLLGIFTAGLLTFATPCVLPLIPIYLSALVGTDIRHLSSDARGQLLFRAILFSIGFISVFTLMGLTASSIGGLLIEYKGVMSGAGALLILIFGLKFLGLIRIPFFDKIIKADDRKFETRFGGFNALIMGVVFAAGWSPCVGPVLGSVLTYTASNASSPMQGAAYLTVYGIGFALPLLITAVFAEAGIKFLKRINPFLPKIEKGIGIFLVLIAVSLIFDMIQTDNLDVDRTNNTQSQISSLIVDDNPVMVEFYSSHCAICERMQPIVEGLVTDCDGQMVRVKQVDVSKAENRHYTKSFRLVGVPTFLFLSVEQEEVARLVGEQTEQTLKQALSALRGKPCPGLGTFNFDVNAEDNTDLAFPEQQDESEAVFCNEGKDKEDTQNTDKPAVDCANDKI